MRCSIQYQNIFSISKAYIEIEWNEKACHFEVKFKDQCNMCGLCAAYCVYGALEIKRGGN